MTRILFITLAALLSACSARTALPPMGEQPLKAKRYQIEVTSHDGLRIAATVWQPQLAAGATAPLVMQCAVGQALRSRFDAQGKGKQATLSE